MSQDEAGRIAERVARESYGRLVAFLAARTRDVAGAEDALGEAFAAALRTWPVDGVPDNPDAWLLTAARRRQTDALRQRQTHKAGEPHLELIGDELRIHSVKADEGPTLKRFRPRAMGRATKIRKRTSHLSITLTPGDGNE